MENPITPAEMQIMSECLKIVSALSLQTEFLNDKHASIRDFDPQTMPYQLVIRSRKILNEATELKTSLTELAVKISTKTEVERKPIEFTIENNEQSKKFEERRVAAGQLNDNGFVLRTGSLSIQLGIKNHLDSGELKFNKDLSDGQKLVLLNAFENSVSDLNLMKL